MNKKMFRTFVSHSIVSVALCAAAFMSMTVEAANVYYRCKSHVFGIRYSGIRCNRFMGDYVKLLKSDEDGAAALLLP